jgi:hypothetical protein
VSPLFFRGSDTGKRPVHSPFNDLLGKSRREFAATVVHFSSIHKYGIRRADSNADFSRPNACDCDANIAVDHDFFTNATCKNQHDFPPWFWVKLAQRVDDQLEE